MQNPKNKFKRVLIANRGEISVRIIRTLQDMGIETVAIYSPADHNSLHCALADYTYPLKGENVTSTYLDQKQIKQAILESKADAVHPGYGFLAENSEFQTLVNSTGAKYIGPGHQAIALLGNKLAAKKLMQTHQIPILPGSQQACTNIDELEKNAAEIGFPIILKAEAGGGGRGIRIVKTQNQLLPAYESCKREAKAYFSDEKVFCEKYIEDPRHIEVQIICDQYGKCLHLGERDCSIQRRHQKVFEETPSPMLSSQERNLVSSLAVKVAKATNYLGLGTVEFLADKNGNFYFIEMNTRIQVEHPITEMVTGLDLVYEQVKVACGEPLHLNQEDINFHGAAMEARITAEDYLNNFAPQSGYIHNCRWPQGPFVRVDTHVFPGFKISHLYDSMLAKIITWAPNREQTRLRLLRSLRELKIEGICQNTSNLIQILNDDDFKSGKYNTNFLQKNLHKDTTEPNYLASALAFSCS